MDTARARLLPSSPRVCPDQTCDRVCLEGWLGSHGWGPGFQQFRPLVSPAQELPLCSCPHEQGCGICRALVHGWVIWVQTDPTRASRWPWQAQRLREPGSLLDSNKEESILYLFYLKSKQFLSCLMSKRFHKLCRENVTHLHLGDFQPLLLAAALEEQRIARAAAPHTLPQMSGGGQGSGGCSCSASREAATMRKCLLGWSHSAWHMFSPSTGEQQTHCMSGTAKGSTLCPS